MASKLLWPATLCLKKSLWESNYGDVKGCWGGRQLPSSLLAPEGRCRESAWRSTGGPHIAGTTELTALLSGTLGLALCKELAIIWP